MGWDDLRGFTDYLVRNDLVPERDAKFYAVWVERWLKFDRAHSEVGRESSRLPDLIVCDKLNSRTCRTSREAHGGGWKLNLSYPQAQSAEV